MRIGKRWHQGSGFALRRTVGGVMEIEADDDNGLARGLGFAHAHDRQVQMMLVRLIGRGRLSECLRADAETEGVDVFMRQMGFAHGLEAEAEALAGPTRSLTQAYCEGVNAYLEANRRPLELALVRYRPEPWRIVDTLLTVRVMSYVGLAQSQADLEKLIVQAIAKGADLDRLRALFRPHLDAVDDELVATLRRVRLVDPLVPPSVRFAPVIPKLVASNNWAVAAGRSGTGSALQCNDPHLDINRLPAVWYEWVGHTREDDRAGISMPGVPGIVMGRNRRVSAGFTYGFMDQVDYVLEDVVDGRCRRADGDEAIRERTEVVQRRGAEPLHLRIRETSHGTLECDPLAPLDDGLYLCRAFSGLHGGAARSLDALVGLLGAHDVITASEAVRDVAISCNWLVADREGRIAYQQSGLMPRRRHSGLHPVPGWGPEPPWDGFVSSTELSSIVDPPEGVLVTANEDRNVAGGPAAINAPMADYRARRIHALLAEHDTLDLADMRRIQADLFSIQADELLALFDPHLPEGEASRVLRTWDRRYDVDARGPVVFEIAYAAVLREVFGRRLFGLEAWDRLLATTPVVADFYGVFDEALRGNDPLWWDPEGKAVVLERALAAALGPAAPPLPPGTWGEHHRITMTNVFFGGALPRWLGFDHGPLPLPGGRATVVQGSLFEAHGRTNTFAPSWRYVTSLGDDVIHTALPGGPSGRRESPLYLADLDRYRAGEYKALDLRGW